MPWLLGRCRSGHLTRFARCLKGSRLRIRLLAGACLILALHAYIQYSPYTGKDYTAPVPMTIWDHAVGPSVQNGSDNGNEVKATSDGSALPLGCSAKVHDLRSRPHNFYAMDVMQYDGTRPKQRAEGRVETDTAWRFTFTTQNKLTPNRSGTETWPWKSFHHSLKPDLPRILFWTQAYGIWFWPLEEEDPKLRITRCPDRCHMSKDRRTLNISDAVVFYGYDMNTSFMPEQRSPFQKWVFWSLEPPWSNPLDTFRGLTETFNWTFTYRLDSDILDPYGNFTLQNSGRDMYPNDTLRRIWQSKSKMAAWAVSNCDTPGRREDYVLELKKYIHIDVYGACGDKVCPRSKEDYCYRSFAKNYYFYLSFENCICKDYVTEKLFKVLKYDIVPVVFGGANYRRVAPPGSFIDALSFNSPKDLALYLKEVANNFSLYSRYFEWKGKYEVWHWTFFSFCALCRRLHSKSFTEKSVVPDLLHWWNTSSHCRAFSRNTKTFHE